MKKILFYLGLATLFSSFVWANETSIEQDIKQNINSIEAEYQQLLIKEAEKVEEFTLEKAQLEEELVVLKQKAENKEKKFEKLERDSQIRWHRDKYKKLLKNYEIYYAKLEKKILVTEEKIAELTRLLEFMR